jgi:hypothetical protein
MYRSSRLWDFQFDYYFMAGFEGVSALSQKKRKTNASTLVFLESNNGYFIIKLHYISKPNESCFMFNSPSHEPFCPSI